MADFYSFSFPDMLTGTSSKLIKDKEAVKSNLILLYKSVRKSLFGDPYFGTDLLRAYFSQNNGVLADLLIDELYTVTITFMPQLFLTRKDIEIHHDGVDIFATVRCIYIPDNTANLYEINLTKNEDF